MRYLTFILMALIPTLAVADYSGNSDIAMDGAGLQQR